MSDVLVVPPFRTPLLTANGLPLSGLDAGNGDKSAGGPPGSRTTTIETTRDWWLYWRTLAELANAGLNMITFGTHADRPDPAGMPDGAIYIESDRSGVIYQNQGGEWHYLAGTMWGTLSPDQRPSDLGVNDAGFDFRSTDSPQREFIWSGTAWIEATPARYGTHAARLATAAAGVVSGMLWMETDRDNVIYQVQTVSGSPAWVYVAGVMADAFGALPAGLGTNDVNFTFATSDTYEVYRWSGAAWVNQTPANNIQVAPSVGTTTLTTTMQDIGGLSITLPRPGRYLAIGVMDFSIAAGDVGNVFTAQLVLPTGGAAAQLIVFTPAGAGSRASVCQQWAFTATAAGQITKMQAAKSGGTGASVSSGHCSLSALWVGP